MLPTAALIVGALALLAAFVPLLGIFVDALLLPILLILILIGLIRRRGSSAKRTSGILLGLAAGCGVLSIPVFIAAWHLSSVCDGPTIDEAAAFVEELRTTCGEGCSADDARDLRQARAAHDPDFEVVAVERAFAEPGPDAREAFSVSFGHRFPCHDKQFVWDSTTPDNWECSDCSAQEIERLEARGFQVRPR